MQAGLLKLLTHGLLGIFNELKIYIHIYVEREREIDRCIFFFQCHPRLSLQRTEEQSLLAAVRN